MEILRKMKENTEEIKERFCYLLEEIAQKEKQMFSGIGLLVYDSRFFANLNSISLRPSSSVPPSLFLGKQNTTDFLIESASIESKIHDGFIFFSEKGLLTHVSQYFGPPPIPNIEPNENYGTRYHAVLFGSFLKGVIITGGITSGNHYYIFENGELKKTKRSKDYKMTKRSFNPIDVGKKHPISLIDAHYYGLKGYGIDFQSPDGSSRPKFHIRNDDFLFSVVPMRNEPDSPYVFRDEKLTLNEEEIPFKVQFIKWVKGTPSYFYYRNIDEWIQTIDNEIVLTTNFQQRCKGCTFCCRDLQKRLPSLTPKQGMDLVMKERKTFGDIGEFAIVTGMFKDEDKTISHIAQSVDIAVQNGFKGHLFYIGSQINTLIGIRKMLDRLNGIPMRYSYTLETFTKREQLHPLKHKSIDGVVDTVNMLKDAGVWKMEYSCMPGIDDLDSFYEHAHKFKGIAKPHVSIFRPVDEKQAELVSHDCKQEPVEYFWKMREHFESLYGGPIYGNNLGNLWLFPTNRINPLFLTDGTSNA